MDISDKSYKKLDNFLNVTALAFVVSSAILYFGNTGWWPDFYHPKFYAIVFLSSAIFILLPKYIFRSEDRCKKESVILLRTVAAVAFITNCLGELVFYQLYKYGVPYDKIIHATNSFFFLIAICGVLEVWKNQISMYALRNAMIILLIGSIAWELFEFTSDYFFKTMEFGIYGKYIISDTLNDVISDIIGIAAGSFVLYSPKLHDKIIGKYRRLSHLKPQLKNTHSY